MATTADRGRVLEPARLSWPRRWLLLSACGGRWSWKWLTLVVFASAAKDSPGPPRNLNYDDDDTGTDDHRATGQDDGRMPIDRHYNTDSRWNHGPNHASGPAAVRGLVPPAGVGLPGNRPHHADAHWLRHSHGDRDGADHPDGDSADGTASGPPVRHGTVPPAHLVLPGDESLLHDPNRHRRPGAGLRGAANHRERHSGDRRRLHGSGKAVILEGLPEDATERDILYGLDYITRDRHFSSDQVRIARLRYDHNSRRIAFVEFHRRADAEIFFDYYHPEVSFRLEHSRGVDSEPITLGVTSPKNRDEVDPSREARRDDDGWDCFECGAVNYPHRAVCYKCKIERPDDGYDASGPFLTGETDQCPQQTPSQYVVVRDLGGSVTEEVLARGVMKLFVENPEPPKGAPTTTNKLKSTAPTNSTVGLGAKPGSLRRVFLMRDRKTKESWRYGFAEFATVEDARAAVAKFRASTKFTIASKPVVVAFIHTGVFVPAFDSAATENPEFSFTPIYNPAVRLKYWDERAYPSTHVVAADPAAGAGKPGDDDASKPGASRPSKKARKEKEPVPGAKIAMMPQVQIWQKASAQLHGGKPAAGSAAGMASTQEQTLSRNVPSLLAGAPHSTEDAQPDGPVAPQRGDQYQSYADWDALTCLACGWQPPSQTHIDERRWPQTRADLLIEHEARAHNLYKDDDETKAAAAVALAALGKQPRAIVRRVPRAKSDALPVYKSYADHDRLRCVLCKRVFKDARLVWLHEQQSALHRRLLADPAHRRRAVDDFRRAGVKMRVLEPAAAFKTAWAAAQGGGPRQTLNLNLTEYRDRARERRTVFGQPKQAAAAAAAAAADAGATTVPEKKRKEPAAAPAPLAKTLREPPAKRSKGAGMLARMGWTAGAGLGAEGAGRTEAIATEVYAPGVGLGAEGGRLGDAGEEAERNVRGGFQAFVEKTRERARERFERLE
ncbi:hypothetical protein BT67DRAFT_398852 [Trichocladium antarcticum]|uniref:RNA-binding protein n=1 Tax=Trichocladium antarcticum TaxID=1450529 RepID=A0AAN6ZGI5_9PEZI|nr:hypothetical protein BT67DRAFT_398852 [Trichocladium antarcticum]